MTIDIDTARTFLFVPGDRPERFAKAAASGADVVIIDLEDAVSATSKAAARRNAIAWIDDGNHCVVRVNSFDTSEAEADVQALSGRDCAVMLPKAEQPLLITERLGEFPVLALIETARGVLAAGEIAATESVSRLVFGSFDLAAELGVSPDDRDALAYARSALVMASAAGNLASPVDGVTAVVDDAAALTDDIRYATRLGFGAKLCIHPAQVGVAASTFAPSADDVDWAERVVVAAEASAVAVVDGRMVDKPVFERARRILTAATRTERRPTR